MSSVEEQLRILRRGTAHVIPEGGLEAKLREGRPLRVKLGVDPTAPDIHLGHTVALHKLRQFQDLGHQAVLIIGDYTAMIGDPSGRSSTRPQLTHEQVMAAAATYQEQVFKVLDRERTEVCCNGDWFSKFTFQDVMRLCAGYTVARMLERDDFAKRMQAQQPIAIHEFLYPLMQAHDSVVVRADVELGGTDQTFNILLGRHLQREAGQPEQVALITPLLEGTDGAQKMSKSLGNYIGIAEPAADIFGKVMSISDELMLRYYELLSDEDVARLRADIAGTRAHPMDAKKRLASMLVERFHGAAAGEHARTEFERRFQRRQLPENIETYTWNEAPAESVPLPKVLVVSGLVASMSEARRTIVQGGVRVDGERITQVQHVLPAGPREWLIQVGPRRIKKIVFPAV
ncbi:MAG TPA: tyrosine--tRNA ligase [Candidatus Binatia bacterium]|nr:tyrosine--tRNA ligase [Candidatus Binatia bacterium]